MIKALKKTHDIGCPVCHKSRVTLTDGEQTNCPNCNSKIRYNWVPPFSLLDAIDPLFEAEVEIEGEWRQFLLPPTMSTWYPGKNLFEE